MRYFSTFSGIGGFEIGIQNAYRSTLGGSEKNQTRDEGQGLLTTKGEDISSKKGFTSERNNDVSDERSLRSDDIETARILQRVSDGTSAIRDDSGIPSEPFCVGYSEIDKYAISVYERNFNGEVHNKPEDDELQAEQYKRGNYSDSIQRTATSGRNGRVKNYGDITKINAELLPEFDCLVGGFPCQAFSVAGKRRGFEDTRGTLFFDLARILQAKQPRLFVFENVKGLLSHDNGNTIKTIFGAIDELGYEYQWQVINSKNHGVPQNRERIIIVGHLRGTSRPEVFPLAETDEQDDRRINIVAHRDIYRRNRQTFSPDGIVEALDTAQGGGRGHHVKGLNRNQNHNAVLSDEQSIRRLTPKECERLQAFPDDWTKYGTATDGGTINISDSQRYKMCGNAVTTNVIRDVFERIFNS